MTGVGGFANPICFIQENSQMFDPTTLIVAGVPLMALVFGLVEFLKDVFSLEGKKVTILSGALGLVLSVPYQLSQAVPVDFAGWFSVGVIGLAFGLAASGFYKFVAARTTKS
jgi:hypothetical protein